MMDKSVRIDGKKYLIKSSYKIKTKNGFMQQSRIDEEVDEPTLAIDVSDISIMPIDGIFIETINGEIKMTCYHHESDYYDDENDVLKCKGIVEFRISTSNYRKIQKVMNNSIIPAPSKHMNYKKGIVKEVSSIYQ